MTVLSEEELQTLRLADRIRQKRCRSNMSKSKKQSLQSKRKEKRSTNRSEIDFELEVMANDILKMKNLSATQLNFIAEGQKYTKHPKLAISYFYSCSYHPEAYVFNDECIRGDRGRPCYERLTDIVEKEVNIVEAVRCQKSMQEDDASQLKTMACASCCEIIIGHESYTVQSLSNLNEEFVLTDGEISAIKCIPKAIWNNHLCILEGPNSKLYHLNPDLVNDNSYIVLCSKCSSNPRSNKFSIASGCDFGRFGDLPKLSMLAKNCIRPYRIFGLDLLFTEGKSLGHGICFPSDGPNQCSFVLPWTPKNEELPTVTFVGTQSSWNKNKNKYRHAYEIPTDAIYKWLQVLVRINKVFQQIGIQIDMSCNRKEDMSNIVDRIEKNAIISANEEVKSVGEFVASNKEIHPDIIHDKSNCHITYSAVLPNVDVLINTPANAAIKAMLDIIVPDETVKTVDEQFPIEITRSADPVLEFGNNDAILGGAFCDSILTGRKIPDNPGDKEFQRHCMRFYDSRFESTDWIAYCFNQLQRCMVTRKAAQVGSSNSEVLNRLGKLVNNKTFRDELIQASRDSKDPKTKRINAYLLRIVSLVGGNAPFSSFERQMMRHRSAAMRYRFGLQTHFVTLAPPEHDNLLLLKIALNKSWNNPDCKNDFSWESLPVEMQNSASCRLLLTSKYPGLSALMFGRTFSSFIRNIVQSYPNSDIRASRNYTQRLSGAFSKVSAFNAVIEPQSNLEGRLHAHVCLYGHTLNPELITRLAASTETEKLVIRWMESTCLTNVSDKTHQWWDRVKMENIKPRPATINVGNASENYELFCNNCEKRAISIGLHKHGPICQKGVRGRYMCRLCRPSGINTGKTCPISLVEKHGSVVGTNLSELDRELLDTPYNLSNGEFMQEHPRNAIVWEQHRTEENKFFVECNRIMALLKTAMHATIINGISAGEAVNEYITKYMIKDTITLDEASTLVIAALNYIEDHPSTAEDSGSTLRTGKHLATRTVNSILGKTQWKPQIMAAALYGYSSNVSSETFWFIFPDQLVTYYDNLKVKKDSNLPRSVMPENTSYPSIRCGNSFQQLEISLAEISSLLDKEPEKGPGGGTRKFILPDKSIVFLTQAESYYNRGSCFSDFSALEFECIVDLKEKKSVYSKQNRGRPPRNLFKLGKGHPLYKTHQAVVRTKFKTAIFGGRPVPKYPGPKPSKNYIKTWTNAMEQFSKYMICLFVPWKLPQEDSIEKNNLNFTETDNIPPTIHGFTELLRKWDSANASYINRQRVRYIHNVMQAHYRNTENEKACSLWRERNADKWKSNNKSSSYNIKNSFTNNTPDEIDNEALGRLQNGADIHDLLTKISYATPKNKIRINQITSSCNGLFDIGDKYSLAQNFNTNNTSKNNPIVFSEKSIHDCGSFKHIVHQLRIMELPECISSTQITVSTANIYDPLVNDNNCNFSSWFKKLNSDQQSVAKYIVTGISSGFQTLTMLHGGGGCGKTFCMNIICDAVKSLGFSYINTCPTGAGACHMKNGQTFHHAFAIKKGKELRGRDLDKLKKTFNPSLKLVVIDEISMLTAQMLELLDYRLRALYDPRTVFGGLSILLVGDFWQLPVCVGTNLYDALYKSNHKSQIITSALIAKFRIFNLNANFRSKKCESLLKLLQYMRKLPNVRPQSVRWTAEDNKLYQPISDDVVKAITTPLTHAEILADYGWINKACVLTTNNFDRAVFNAIRAHQWAIFQKKVIVRWRLKIRNKLSSSIKNLLFDPDVYPQLFGYFVVGAPAQILDNCNGNVAFGVANGTNVIFHSLVWLDSKKENTARQIIQGTKSGDVAHLPFAPDFINVQLLNRDGSTWPEEYNLETSTYKIDGKQVKASVIIPIGLVTFQSEQHKIRIGEFGAKSRIIEVVPHATELAFSITVWKSQGSTFEYALIHLDQTGNSTNWKFEHLYVALSRVQHSHRFRCVPTSNSFDKKRIKNLRPNIRAVKFLMDINSDGHWSSTMKIKHQAQRHASNSKMINHFTTDNVPLSSNTVRSDNHFPQSSKQASFDDPLKGNIGKHDPQQHAAKANKLKSCECLWSLPEDRYITVIGNIRLYGRDFSCLAYENWLSDNIIDAFIILLTEKIHSPGIFCLQTTFWQLLTGLAGDEYNIDTVISWTQCLLFTQKDSKQVLVPLNVNGNHWALSSVHIQDKVIYYYDSLGIPPPPSFFETIMRFLEDIMNMYQGCWGEKSLWRPELCIKDNLPAQKNSVDCGVFLLKYVEHILTNTPMNFSQHHIPAFRRQISGLLYSYD